MCSKVQWLFVIHFQISKLVSTKLLYKKVIMIETKMIQLFQNYETCRISIYFLFKYEWDVQLTQQVVKFLNTKTNSFIELKKYISISLSEYRMLETMKINK